MEPTIPDTSPTDAATPAAVWAVVVTFNRKDLLKQCLDALAGQTHPLAGVVVVDNASTDGTADELRSWEVLERLHVRLLALPRNGGGSEGFHAGLAEAERQGAEWVWAMDDDCVPTPAALATLLGSDAAADPETVAVVPVVESMHGGVQPVHSGGRLHVRLFGSVASFPEHHYAKGEHRLGYFSFVGPLIRAEALRRTEPPRRQYFVWGDDLEFSTRLARLGKMYVVTAARVVHKDGQPAQRQSFASLLRARARPIPDAALWKHAYGLRNLIHWGRHHRAVSQRHLLGWIALFLVRSLLFDPDKAFRVRVYLLMARDGWHGRFRTLAPATWKQVPRTGPLEPFFEEHALEYGELPPSEALSRPQLPAAAVAVAD